MPRREDEARVRADPRFWLIKLTCIVPFLLIIPLVLPMIGDIDPSFSIRTFYVPALNKFLNQSTVPDADTIIFFDLKLENPSKDRHCGPINLTFSYATANTSMAIGTYTIGAGFCQVKGEKAIQRDVAVVTGSMLWREAAMSALSNGSTANFRLDLVTEVRFKHLSSYSGKENVAERCTVKVDDSGKKVGNKPVQLSNPRRTSQALVLIFGIIGLLVACLVLGVLLAFCVGTCLLD